MPEEDQAMAIGSMHKKFGKDCACGSRDILADRQRHIHYNTAQLLCGWSNSYYYCYPHMPIGKVWIYRLLFVCLFVWLRISPSRIKLLAPNFAWRFIGILGRESHILGNFADTKAQNRTNWPAREGGWMFQLVTPRRAYQVHAACGRRIGMCWYTSIPQMDILVIISATNDLDLLWL